MWRPAAPEAGPKRAGPRTVASRARARALAKKTPLGDRIVDKAATRSGKLAFVALVAAEIGWNLIPGLPQFDPTRFVLNLSITLGTNALGQLILMKKNRRQARIEKQLAKKYRDNREVLRGLIRENTWLDNQLETRELTYVGPIRTLWTEADLIEHTPEERPHKRTLGDRVLGFVGSGRGVFAFLGVGAAEIAFNSIPFLPHFDGFPFTQLNLGFSLATAMLGLVNLDQENQQDARDDVGRQADVRVTYEAKRLERSIEKKQRMIDEYDSTRGQPAPAEP
jgi:uncharacterized membrane protein